MNTTNGAYHEMVAGEHGSRRIACRCAGGRRIGFVAEIPLTVLSDLIECPPKPLPDGHADATICLHVPRRLKRAVGTAAKAAGQCGEDWVLSRLEKTLGKTKPCHKANAGRFKRSVWRQLPGPPTVQ